MKPGRHDDSRRAQHDTPTENTDDQQADQDPVRYGPPLVTLKKRSEFLRLRGGARWSGPAFLMEARPPPEPKQPRAPEERQTAGTQARFGFTVTKKLGSAVTRNRIRRRLSHAIRAAMIAQYPAPLDYVVVARPAAADRPFNELVADVTRAFGHIAKAKTKTTTGLPPRPRDTT